MIYRNSDFSRSRLWSADHNPEAGLIARHFLTGELDLLRFSRSTSSVLRDLSLFLDASSGLDIEVHRAENGDILVTVSPWHESLLLTGRTANVLRSYIDAKLVKMEDRFDMTVRHAAAF